MKIVFQDSSNFTILRLNKNLTFQSAFYQNHRLVLIFEKSFTYLKFI